VDEGRVVGYGEKKRDVEVVGLDHVEKVGFEGGV
jgi:hypothetical protein